MALCAKGFESEEFRVPELETDYKEVREACKTHETAKQARGCRGGNT